MTLKIRFLTVALVLAGLVATVFPQSQKSPVEESQRGVVTAVYDGDTVKVRLDSGEEPRVRLIGVDSPEYDDDRESVRMMAFLAKRFSYLNLYGKDVRLTFGPERHDVYGRLLAFLRLEDGTIFNETMIREGYAFAYLKFPFDGAFMKNFKEAEVEARESGRGLWRGEPWPLVDPGEAGRWEGRIVSVRFRCVRTYERGRFRILDSGTYGFQAVIPLDLLAAFPGSLNFEDRTLVVSGIVERYRGTPQIMIGVSLQIEILRTPLISMLYTFAAQKPFFQIGVIGAAQY